MSTPHINPDDPKWTAYVLGELDENERAEIERLLESSEEARALVEELTVATTSMKEELTSLLPLMMTPEQRTAIRDAAKPAPKRWFEVFPAKWGLGLAAAAIVVMAVALPITLRDKTAGQKSAEVKTKASEISETDAAVSSKERVAQTVPAVAPTTAATSTVRSQESSAVPSAAKSATGTTVAPVLTPAQVVELVQDGPPAQSTPQVRILYGSQAVTGTVKDSSGAFIPGVTVRASGSDTGTVATTLTNEAGAYSFAGLNPGKYTLSASLPGFQTMNLTDVQIAQNTNSRYNFELAVASLSTKVEVSVSAAQTLAKQGASVGQVLDQKTVQELPLVGNDVLDLIAVMPGVQATAANSPANTSFAGVRAENSTTVRDGIAVTDGRSQVSPPTVPPPAVRAAPTQTQGQQGQGQQAGGARGGGGGGRGNQGNQGQGQQGQVSGVVGGVVGGTLAERARVAGAPPPPPPPPPPPAAMPAPSPVVAADRIYNPGPNTEAYDRVVDNPFIRTTQESLATFSIDVDTASYANVRRFLTQNQLPPRDSVRIEELVNYFSYDYAQPSGSTPIAPNMEVAAAPWHPTNRLVRIGIKAREVDANRRPPSNLVFLIDVSGSMNSAEKLPLVKAGLNMLVEGLGENDSVSIVVYAGNSGLVLAPTSGVRKAAIRQAIDSLQPGGSTNGASGIQLAYNQATANFLRGGVNRVILMTDGDFNVGITNQGDLTRLIEERAKSGVFLSVLGFGMGNYKDSTLEKLADQGNGNYAYIDNITEARKVLVEEMSGTLVTVAKDVKIQVDFNPARVEAYRLIGYENRVLRTEDFNNDAKDAGDMGAGHTVTALFEVVPKGGEVPGPSIDPSIYTRPQVSAPDANRNAGSTSNEMLTLRVRYKLPDASTSTRMDVPLVDRGGTFARATTDFRFAASVAEFGMILRNSPYKGNARMDSVLDLAEGSLGADRNGYRKEFITLVEKARSLGR